MSASQARRHFVSRGEPRRVFHQLPVCIEHEGISTIQDRERRKRFQAGGSTIEGGAAGQQSRASGGAQVRNFGFELLANCDKPAASVIMSNGSGRSFEPATASFEQLTFGFLQPEAPFIE